jgi:hypothetical protein
MGSWGAPERGGAGEELQGQRMAWREKSRSQRGYYLFSREERREEIGRIFLRRAEEIGRIFLRRAAV